VDSPSVYLNLKFICKNNRSTIYRVTTNTTRQPGAEFWSSTAHGTPFSRLPVALPCLGDWRLETRGGPDPCGLADTGRSCDVHGARAEDGHGRARGTRPTAGDGLAKPVRMRVPREKNRGPAPGLAFPRIAHGSRPCVPVHSTDKPRARAAVGLLPSPARARTIQQVHGAPPAKLYASCLAPAFLLVFTGPNAKIVMQGCSSPLHRCEH
jgi:hypothetical protein